MPFRSLKVALGAKLVSSSRVRLSLVAPPFGNQQCAAMHARLQLIRLAARSQCSSSWCSASPDARLLSIRRRRQHVIPDSHPISSGSSSHWMPVRSTNRMPVSAARSGIRVACHPWLLRNRRQKRRNDRLESVEDKRNGHAHHESDRQPVKGFERRSKLHSEIVG